MSANRPLRILALVGMTVILLAPHLAVAQPADPPLFGSPTVVTPVASAAPGDAGDDPGSGEAEPAATGTPAAIPAAQPDACEPNDTPEQACPLPLDAISGPFTIAPEADRDVYRLDLPASAALQTEITAHATAGLALVLSASQGPALLASGTISLTLSAVISGPVLLRVENRDPRPTLHERYRIEVRRRIVPQTPAPDPADGAQPDALENNWSSATAAPIAVGAVYDLSLVCPEARPDACPGGDHDYLRVPVKAGVPYLLATFDLDPGVDPVIELFWRDPARPVAGNDDIGPGGLLAALTWTPPADGLLTVRVAPRNGGVAPRLLEDTAARYRFAIAPRASELATTLWATIRDQANLPTPTATATAAPTSGAAGGGAAGSGAGITGGSTPQIPGGSAIILRETVLHHEPRAASTALATLAPETVVTVRGPISGLWVSVEAAASILPGWVIWSDLRRVGDGQALPTTTPPAGATAAAPTLAPGGSITPPATAATATTGGPTTAPTRSPSPTVVPFTITPLDPALPPAPAAPGARVPIAITVIIAVGVIPPDAPGAFGGATPTPDLRRPVGGVRVQIVNAFGDVLAAGLTDAAGRVQLSRDLRPTDALVVQIPAWGLAIPLLPGQTTLLLSLPEARP